MFFLGWVLVFFNLLIILWFIRNSDNRVSIGGWMISVVCLLCVLSHIELIMFVVNVKHCETRNWFNQYMVKNKLLS